MLIEVIAAFLGIALFLYCVLAGADFGAGILEAFAQGKDERAKEQREAITHAMAPVWEANHVWIIIVIVILFMGFPAAFSRLSVNFHIPLTLMLLGIVLRGCAFTFRHYDVIQDRSQEVYSWTFVISSVITPLLMGIIAGGLILGKIPPPSLSYSDQFIFPWLHGFSFSMGLFVCSLFSFLAAVYLIGEARSESVRALFVRRARFANLSAVGAGLLVFASAQWMGFPLAGRFIEKPVSLLSMFLATALLWPLWRMIRKNQIFLSRVMAASQMGLVLLGWFGLQYPVLIPSSEPTLNLTLYNSAAPQATLLQLLYALLAGCALIFPAMGYLFLIFKRNE